MKKKNQSKELIELVPANNRWDNGKALLEMVERTTLRLLGILIAIVALLILVRLFGVFIIKHSVATVGEDISRVAGVDYRVEKWMTGIVSWAASLAVLGLIGSMIIGLIWPFTPAIKIWKPALILLLLSGFGALLPVAIKAVRGVDDAGLPARMAQVDPAEAVWFDPSGNALIYYANHLDDEQRFWNRPGNTPRDSAVAFPVTQAIYQAWAERASQEIAEEKKRREQEERNAKLKTALEKQKVENARVQARLEELKAMYAAQNNRGAEDIPPAIEKLPVNPPSAAPLVARVVSEMSAPSAAVAEPADKIETIPLRFGFMLTADVHGNSIECWSNGVVAISDDHSRGRRRIIQAGQRIWIANSQKVHADPASRSASRLFIRTITPNLDWYRSQKNMDIAMAQPGGIKNQIAPSVEGIHTVPLPFGRPTIVDIKGDTIECWSNGPVEITDDNSKGRQKVLQAGERIRISNSQKIYTYPTARNASSLYIRTISPKSNHPPSKQNTGSTRRPQMISSMSHISTKR